MRFNISITLALLSALTLLTYAHEIPQNKTNCPIRETINITEGGAIDNYGRFHHGGLIYESGQFAEFDYVFFNSTHEIPADPHIRGCVCALRPCIRLCKKCSEFDPKANGTCVKTDVLTVPSDADGLVMEHVKLDGEKYQVLVGRPCREMFHLDAVTYPDDDVWYFDVSSAK